MTESTDQTSTVNICFKLSGSPQFSLSLKLDLTILDVKKAAEPKCDIPPSQQRLIYKGRILKEHETLEDLKIGDGHIMHLVKSCPIVTPSPKQSPATTTGNVQPPQQAPTGIQTPVCPPCTNPNPQIGGFPAAGLMGMTGMEDMRRRLLPDPNQLQEMMGNPLMQQMIQQVMRNPEMMRTILQSSPFGNMPGMAAPGANPTQSGEPPVAGGGGDANPLSNMMRMSMQLMQDNPDLLVNILQNPQGLGIPGGGIPGMPGMPGGGMPDAGMSADPNNPLSNPLFASMFGGGGMAPTANTSVPAAERYHSQLDTLREMGFIDRDANLLALTESNGDVDAAITRLLDRGIGN